MMIYEGFYDKKHGICTRRLTPWLRRVLRVSVGVLIPTGTRRTPISARAHLQLGGSLVPRSTRLWLKLPRPYSLGLRALVMGNTSQNHSNNSIPTTTKHSCCPQPCSGWAFMFCLLYCNSSRYFIPIYTNFSFIIYCHVIENPGLLMLSVLILVMQLDHECLPRYVYKMYI